MKQIDAVAGYDGRRQRTVQVRRPKRSIQQRSSIRRILVPVDFSPVSSHALDYAVRRARECNAELLLLHVRDPILAHQEFVSPRLRTLRAEARRGIRKRLASLAEERLAGKVPGIRWIVDGKPAAVINEVAERAQCDLIIMGSVGRGGIGRLLLGSVAEAVIREASCPVTVVPPAGRLNRKGGRPGILAGGNRGAAIVLIGPPGSGKTTIARGLAEHRSMPVIEVGNLLKLEVERGTTIGKTIQPYTGAGKLVPFEKVEEVLSNALKSIQDDVVLFDGIPRATNQIVPFLQLLVDHGFDLFAVVVITIDIKTAIERLSGRRVCSGCGTLYNIAEDSKKLVKRCKRCGGELLQRQDDRKEVVEARYKRFEVETLPVINFFKEEFGRMTLEISGTKSKERRIKTLWHQLQRLVPQIA